MLDWYLLLTPLLVLPIFLLFRFVGCDALFGLDHITTHSYEDIVTEESSLVAFWLLNDQNSTQAKDVKKAHDGLYGVPGPTTDQGASQGADGTAVQGKPGIRLNASKSVDFEGGYVVVPAHSALNTASFTVECWLASGVGVWRTGFDHALVTSAEIAGMNPSVCRGFSIFARSQPDGRWRWSASLGTGGPTFVDITGPEVVLSAKRTYFALTHETGGSTTFFVGIDNESPTTMPLSVAGYVPAKINHLYIGANTLAVPPAPSLPSPSDPGPPVLYPFLGRIAEVAVYNTALSATTLTTHRDMKDLS